MANPQSSWLKPCCGKRATVWHVFLLSAGVNSFLVACVIIVVILMTMELLIDTRLLQFSNASQCSGIIHWISLSILSLFFVETVVRIIVLGIWDYIENKVEVLDGAVIILSLAPMVASTVANGPSSPWDAISLFISLRIWRLKRIIDAYVLPLKVDMEIMVQQYEKTKLIQEEQLERLTQMCQEQAFEIRQLRAHLAQQDLDLVAERERAFKLPHDLQNKNDRFKVVSGRDSDEEATENITELSHEMIMKDDMNNYITQYYNEASSESGVPGTCIITTAAIDVHHHPNISSDLYSAEVPFNAEQASNSSSITSVSGSRSSESSETLAQSISSQAFCSSTDCSTREESTEYCPLAQTIRNRVNKTAVQELLSSLSDDSSFIQKGLDPANVHLSNPIGLHTRSPRHGLNICNRVNREGFGAFHDRSVIPLNLPLLESKPINTELK
ncbi:transmembrane protein 266 isoform X1 [Bufo gargarizans]|uniref:transmembrane protein 266 isoform X1 n=1 Tax=Bufo gargarizans TaxID=30331 RepID=UPI001CF334A7|nr:transmembrane protein 266 isoform X1 [Bufo gargarizans]XP_044135822.1 transmembrane protein 266 isoform X1 [Bufo gargarizans]XP_044135823.1 transmembrane protein 266 isoform X1 [Bufo gargarizans]XP_044135824.1 transmembrane protein 266 isoform X1 [Bufo gargarizans]XP_044135825.1 transmembrane protein 266 isoform X1 [Bufo gargarizans]XP_044135826.1 transmembrane protein 266 isoform X1 [Bufo gargarizans]